MILEYLISSRNKFIENSEQVRANMQFYSKKIKSTVYLKVCFIRRMLLSPCWPSVYPMFWKPHKLLMSPILRLPTSQEQTSQVNSPSTKTYSDFFENRLELCLDYFFSVILWWQNLKKLKVDNKKFIITILSQ